MPAKESLIRNLNLLVPFLRILQSFSIVFGRYCVWHYNIVRKGLLAPPPFLSHPPLDQACPLLKSLCPLSSFLFHPVLRCFRQFPPPSWQNPPVLILPTNLSWFKQISKGQIYHFNCHFLSKINFNLLNPFTNRLS